MRSPATDRRRSSIRTKAPSSRLRRLRRCSRPMRWPSAWMAKAAGSTNVFVERLWRSVKYEDVYLHAYDTPAALRAGLTGYFQFYNGRRRHSSLGRRTPSLAQQFLHPVPAKFRTWLTRIAPSETAIVSSWEPASACLGLIRFGGRFKTSYAACGQPRPRMAWRLCLSQPPHAPSARPCFLAISVFAVPAEVAVEFCQPIFLFFIPPTWRVAPLVLPPILSLGHWGRWDFIALEPDEA